MNEELKNQAVTALADTISNAARAKDFVLGQLPDVCEQLLAWRFIASVSTAVLPTLACTVVCTAAGLFLARAIRGYRKARSSNSEEIVMCAAVTLAVCAVISSTALCTMTFPSALEALQVAYAPKVYLIEYAAKLVKGGA